MHSFALVVTSKKGARDIKASEVQACENQCREVGQTRREKRDFVAQGTRVRGSGVGRESRAREGVARDPSCCTGKQSGRSRTWGS